MIRKIQTLKKRLFGGYNWASRTRAMRIKHHHVFKRTRRYHRHGSIALAILIIFSFVATYSNIPPIDVYAESGSSSVYADGDFGPNNFANLGGNGGASCAGGTHCDYIDESGESAYLNTGVNMDATTAEEEFTFANPAVSGTLLSVDSIDVVVRGYTAACNGSGGTPCDSFNVRIFIDGAYNGTTNSTGALTLAPANYTLSWTGLNATTADDLRVEVVRVAEGGGSGSAKDDDVYLYDIRVDVNYTYIPAPPMLTQEAFVWENDDGDEGGQTTVTKFPSTVTNELCNEVSITTWVNPQNASTSDNIDATRSNTAPGGFTTCLHAVDFGFDIPLYATIEGIQIFMEGRVTNFDFLNPTWYRGDAHMWPLAAGFTEDQTATWPSLENTTSTGSSSDLWNTAWTANDINSSGFGVSVSAEVTGSQPTQFEVDAISVAITYSTLPSTAQSGSEFSTAVAMDNVRQGERLNLRMHLKNTGEGAITADDELALFYDRGDDIWTKVEGVAPDTSTGSGCDWTDFTCYSIGTSISASSIAIDQNGIVRAAIVSSGSLILATYVGSGGNCDTVYSGSDAWQCYTVITEGSGLPQEATIKIDDDGNPWIAYRLFDDSFFTDDLKVARYVGSGGTGCADSTWQCTLIDATDSVGRYANITFDSSGVARIAYQDNTNANLELATFVGSGGNCDTVGGGSDAWQCETIEATGTVGANNEIALGQSGDLWISYYDGSNLDLKVAKYTGTGTETSCGGGSSDWDCVTVDATGTVGTSTSIGMDQFGQPWIGYRDGGSNLNLKVAKYTGTGTETSCGGGSSDWDCVTVDATDDVGQVTDIEFDSSGTAWVSYFDNTNDQVNISRYVGSGGNCDTVGGGSDAWECNILDTVTGANSPEVSTAFDASGKPLVLYRGNNTTLIAEINRQGEIMATSSEVFQRADALTTSHSDMTSATDVTNRDDADCISGSTTWNNGVYFGSAVGTGLSLPAGDTTAQCTEVMWTLDTSQATPGTTYRFVVATKDSFDTSKSTWRGPIQIDEYPTITIADDFEQSIRYSKSLTNSYDACSGSANWSCTSVFDSAVQSGDFSTAVLPDGRIAISIYQNSSLKYAEYVGSGGTGCASGVTDWSCTAIEAVGTSGSSRQTSLAISPSGNPAIAFYDGGIQGLQYAEYVGSGGNGCSGTAEWTCTVVDDDASSIIGTNASLGFNSLGIPYISYIDATSSVLRMAYRMGSNAGFGCGSSGSSDWSCLTVDGSSATYSISSSSGTSLEIYNNVPHIAYFQSSALQLRIAKYIGSGGTSCGDLGSSAWECVVVDDDASTASSGRPSLSFNSMGVPYVSYTSTTDFELRVANFVGGGAGSGCGSAGSSDWTCVSVDDDASYTITITATSLVFDSMDTPHVAYRAGSDAKIAKYVGSGGSNCGSLGSSAWDCELIDTDNTSGSHMSLVIDHNGVLHAAFLGGPSFNELFVANTYLPSTPLGTNLGGTKIPSGDYLYHLSSGRSPYNQKGVNCSGNSAYAGYCGLNSDNGDYDSLIARSAHEMPLYGLATKNPNNTVLPKIQWIGNTNLAPSTASTAGDIVIEVYRFGTTNAWEEVARENSSTNCLADNCALSGIPSGTASEYFETINGEYWIYYRVYQEIDGTTTINFKVDGLKVLTTAQELGGGGFFRDGVELPLNQRR